MVNDICYDLSTPMRTIVPYDYLYRDTTFEYWLPTATRFNQWRPDTSFCFQVRSFSFSTQFIEHCTYKSFYARKTWSLHVQVELVRTPLRKTPHLRFYTSASPHFRTCNCALSRQSTSLSESERGGRRKIAIERDWTKRSKIKLIRGVEHAYKTFVSRAGMYIDILLRCKGRSQYRVKWIPNI